jgi:polar amino acid transport system ATP-binding protein/sulfate transport system ATP-binding protein
MTTEHSYHEVLLSVRGLSVARGRTLILRDLNLEIRNLKRPGVTQGQVVGLLGPSGIGKSTLFQVLAGLEEPDAGEILVGPDARPVRRGGMGVVAQNYPLFAHRTVLGNLVIAARRNGIPAREAETRARELLEQFDMDEHARKYPAQLSGGQRQRVAIAQQFMCSDDFLLMDEPFTGLDLIAEENLLGFIRRISQTDERITFIIITHDVEAAAAIADTLWVLGRDRNETGEIVPGARVQAIYNLAERGLAWQEKLSPGPEYQRLITEIRELFPRL